ncbi:MAG: hypothetical protein JWM11_1346 [Planctomycetaceae bacterium]|nr:hypothetical protein [Planctomycetaceae bacterium]
MMFYFRGNRATALVLIAAFKQRISGHFSPSCRAFGFSSMGFSINSVTSAACVRDEWDLRFEISNLKNNLTTRGRETLRSTAGDWRSVSTFEQNNHPQMTQISQMRKRTMTRGLIVPRRNPIPFRFVLKTSAKSVDDHKAEFAVSKNRIHAFSVSVDVSVQLWLLIRDNVPRLTAFGGRGRLRRSAARQATPTVGPARQAGLSAPAEPRPDRVERRTMTSRIPERIFDLFDISKSIRCDSKVISLPFGVSHRNRNLKRTLTSYDPIVSKRTPFRPLEWAQAYPACPRPDANSLANQKYSVIEKTYRFKGASIIQTGF